MWIFVFRHVLIHPDLYMVMSCCVSVFCLVWKSQWECVYLPLKIALPQHINIYICNCHKSVSLANVWVAKVTLGDFYWRTHKLELRNSWKKWELMATQHHYHKVSYPNFQKMKQTACWRSWAQCKYNRLDESVTLWLKLNRGTGSMLWEKRGQWHFGNQRLLLSCATQWLVLEEPSGFSARVCMCVSLQKSSP